jgi:hypothetical protein
MSKAVKGMQFAVQWHANLTTNQKTTGQRTRANEQSQIKLLFTGTRAECNFWESDNGRLVPFGVLIRKKNLESEK